MIPLQEYAKRLRAENEKLREGCLWLVRDISYKAPEQLEDSRQLWINKLREMLRDKK